MLLNTQQLCYACTFFWLNYLTHWQFVPSLPSIYSFSSTTSLTGSLYPHSQASNILSAQLPHSLAVCTLTPKHLFFWLNYLTHWQFVPSIPSIYSFSSTTSLTGSLYPHSQASILLAQLPHSLVVCTLNPKHLFFQLNYLTHWQFVPSLPSI